MPASLLFVMRDTGETVGLFPLIQSLVGEGHAVTALVRPRIWGGLSRCVLLALLLGPATAVSWLGGTARFACLHSGLRPRRTAADGCGWLRAAAGGCGWLRVAAGGCGWLSQARCGCVVVALAASGGHHRPAAVVSWLRWLLRVAITGPLRLCRGCVGCFGWPSQARCGCVVVALAASGGYHRPAAVVSWLRWLLRVAITGPLRLCRGCVGCFGWLSHVVALAASGGHHRPAAVVSCLRWLLRVAVSSEDAPT
jgi:hypothetical protein